MSAGTEPRILMCPPDYYGIEYEINPWMSRSRPSDSVAANRQWSELRLLLERAGARISTMEPIAGLPDLVFTANAALIYRSTALLAHFRHPQRQGEEPIDAAWFAGHGFEVVRPPGEVYFEGAGDALFCGDTLFAGYRIRSDAQGHQRIGELLGCRVIPLELVDGYYYHLDTCFCPLADGLAIYYPSAFDDYGRRVLPELVGELIEVTDDEARRFACNAVVVGRTVVTNTGCTRLHCELRARGLEAWETPLDEFVKAGGSAKCLTLRLDGEEAAGWKRAEGQGGKGEEGRAMRE
ncbi:MAG TPA: arginine deiminase-related protein [Pirellulales bacterium]|nr:arginine deiminase-related protein [Pirellulales bacterium]